MTPREKRRIQINCRARELVQRMPRAWLIGDVLILRGSRDKWLRTHKWRLRAGLVTPGGPSQRYGTQELWWYRP